MKKKFLISMIIVIVFIFVVAITLITACIFNNEKSNQNQQEENDVKTIILELTDKDAKEKELKKLTGIENIKHSIILGPDSDLREKPSYKIIKKYKLTKYEKQQKIYADKVEKAFMDNLKYKLIDTRINQNDETIQTIELRGFYYQMFINDWLQLSIKIMELAGYDLKQLETDTKTQVVFYKSKIKALEIMSPYLENYKNDDEKLTFTIVCINGEPKNSGEMVNLLSNLRGMTYSNMDFSKDYNVKSFEERVNGYYTTAITTEILNKKSPLKLK